VLGEGGGPELVVVPRGASVSDDAWQVSTPATIGDECRLHGNVRAERIAVGRDTELFGSLRAKGDVVVGQGTVVHGDVTTRSGAVTIDAGATVRGDVSCDDLDLHDAADVDGTIRADGEVSISREPVGTPDLGEIETASMEVAPAIEPVDADEWTADHSRLGDEGDLPPVETVERRDPLVGGAESGQD